MVVHETIDGETILIHMGTGTYYSVDGAGSEMWALAAAGLPLEEIVSSISTRYDEARGVVRECVSRLIEELIAEDLLVELAVANGAAVELPEEVRASFAAPVLHRYTDMQEFMLVDPLHDVDELAGWPNVKAG